MYIPQSVSALRVVNSHWLFEGKAASELYTESHTPRTADNQECVLIKWLTIGSTVRIELLEVLLHSGSFSVRLEATTMVARNTAKGLIWRHPVVKVTSSSLYWSKTMMEDPKRTSWWCTASAYAETVNYRDLLGVIQLRETWISVCPVLSYGFL